MAKSVHFQTYDNTLTRKFLWKIIRFGNTLTMKMSLENDKIWKYTCHKSM